MRKLRHKDEVIYPIYTVRKWWNYDPNPAVAMVFKWGCSWLVQGPESLARPSLKCGKSVVGHDVQAVGGGQVLWGLVRSLDFLPSTMGSHPKVWRRSVKSEISLAMKRRQGSTGKQSS